MKLYEKTLPDQYAEIVRVRFGDVKTGFWYDMKAVFPGILLTIIGWIVVKPTPVQVILSVAISAVGVYPYFGLHELLHGFVVMVMTGQRVKIGFSKSGAFCGMPDLYTTKLVEVCCTAAPLAVFAVLYGAGTVMLIVGGHWLFMPFGLLLTVHFLACRSDINLLKEMRKYKGRTLLIKDTGTEQWFYTLKEKR